MVRPPQSTGNQRQSESARSTLAAQLRQWIVWSWAASLSGILLWLSFPPVQWSWLAWVSLVPLATLVRTPWQERPIYRPATVGGLVFGLLAVHWIRYADDQGLTGYYGWWALAAYLSLYFPLFILIARIAVLRFRIPITLAVPTVWVGLEYLRSWLLTGFPWYYLSHTQWPFVRLIQISDIFGAFGVSFLVALVNGWMLDLLAVPLVKPSASRVRLAPAQIWRVGTVATAIAAALIYGTFCLRALRPEQGPRVAVVQTSIPQRVKADEERVPEIHQGYWKQLSDALSQKPDIVIWPETAYRYPLPLIATDVTDDDIRRSIPESEIEPEELREYARQVRESLASYARRGGVSILMGLNTETFERTGSHRFNSAFLIAPDGSFSAPYHKIYLVPWGEYLPLRDWMPWLRIFTPHASADYGLEAGTESERLALGRWKFGVLICFEDTVPWVARKYLQENTVDFLVNISNDGWFGVREPDESEASLWRRAEHEVHLAISVFRAVECRRPLVRAVNTGVSAIIDSNGRILQSAGSESADSKLAETVLVANIPLDHRRSLYARTGDWFGVTAYGLTMAILISGIGSALSRRMRARQNQSKP